MTLDIGALVVFTTVPDENLAVKITESLLQQRLAACVHRLPAGKSTYRWQGKLESSEEIILIIKSTTSAYAELETTIRRLHSYQVPEIVALPIVAGLPAYLKWIQDETEHG
ncbi:MAG: divalent-cation tolerance protein CutA [Betaproteobacteria bacterium]|nr:divalent-cation tolerance protein CutA [Betaproteobacteria bacterium]